MGPHPERGWSLHVTVDPIVKVTQGTPRRWTFNSYVSTWSGRRNRPSDLRKVDGGWKLAALRIYLDLPSASQRKATRKADRCT
jgi:hypothetical protein